MRISDRIYKIAELAEQGETVCDIGTDHGYVPMLLVRNGISPRVIMSDISEDSLAKAVETFRSAGLKADPVDFRVGDGFENIKAGETDAAVIAGLGGYTISDILDADPEKSRSFRKLILQPRKYSGVLRHYLYTHGWDIDREILAREGKFECEIILAHPTDITYREGLYPSDDIRWKYPELMVTSNPDAAKDKLVWKIGSLKSQISNLRLSSKDNEVRMKKLEGDMEYLQGLLKKINNG